MRYSDVRKFKLVFGVMIGLLLLFAIRQQSAELHGGASHLRSWTTATAPVVEKILAGPLAGLISDFRMLDVFAIYYEATQLNNKQAFAYLPVYLNRAQHLDPKFFDVYRLASSILAYDAHMPQASVDLLRQGFVARPDVWEFPFFAGFIAHDMLHDDELAFDLISVGAEREGVPLFLVTLASRFLASSSSTEDAIVFLRGLLQMMPADKQGGILQRIQELEKKQKG